MYNYMGEERLMAILKNYLENTAPKKLDELKRLEASAKDRSSLNYRYRWDKGSEWLKTRIVVDGKIIDFEMFSAVKLINGERVVFLNENIFFESYNNENYSFSTRESIYHSYAFYDKDFAPIAGAGSPELMCDTVRKISEK